MFDIILSKDYRQFMIQKGFELSDWDKATMIYKPCTIKHGLAEADVIREEFARC